MRAASPFHECGREVARGAAPLSLYAAPKVQPPLVAFSRTGLTPTYRAAAGRMDFMTS